MADTSTGAVSTALSIQNAVKTYAPIVIVGAVGYWAVKKFILKKGRKPKY